MWTMCSVFSVQCSRITVLICTAFWHGAVHYSLFTDLHIIGNCCELYTQTLIIQKSHLNQTNCALRTLVELEFNAKCDEYQHTSNASNTVMTSYIFLLLLQRNWNWFFCCFWYWSAQFQLKNFGIISYWFLLDLLHLADHVSPNMQ